jgi:hypothetical protein
MRPGPGEVLHFSEDPGITRFVPHVAATAQRPEAYVWAVNAAAFKPVDPPVPNACVATEPVLPLGPPEPVGSLLQLHEEAGIQLRVLPNLWPFWDTVITTTLGWSGIRLRNALRRPGR